MSAAARLPPMLLALCAMTTAIATEPRVAAQPPSGPQGDARQRSGEQAPPAVSRPPVDARRSAATAPLDLKLGDASRYFPPGELAIPLDERLEEIIVNGQRPEPIRDGRDVPPGLFPSLRHVATHPLDAWRILAPMPGVQIPDRTVDDPTDPPGTYRGRILEPGAIYD